jgi:hypothetical protein
MSDAGASQGNKGDLTRAVPQPNSNLNPIIKSDDSVGRATMPPKTKMTFQEALLMGQKFSKPLGISLENPVTNPWKL